jgi:hypothetical protein
LDKSAPLIQFGPLCAQLVGNHAVAKWAAKTFAPRHELDTADVGLVIEFVGRSLPKPQNDAKSFRFNGRFFQCQIETGSQWRMYVRATKGDSLTLRLRKPNLAWKTWLSHGTSLEVLWLKEFCYQIFPFVAMCKLVQTGAAIIHASCFEVNGRVILLPAMGGIGKSAVMSWAVLNGLGRFYSDDLVVLDHTGKVFFSPIPIHYYKYHLETNNVLANRVLSKGSLQWSLAKTLYPKRAVRWVSPFDVWDKSEIGADAVNLSDAFLMSRTGGEFKISRLSVDDMATACTRIIFGEIGHMMDRLAMADQDFTHPSALISPVDAWNDVRKIYSSCFATVANLAHIDIPKQASPSELVQFLVDEELL